MNSTNIRKYTIEVSYQITKVSKCNNQSMQILNYFKFFIVDDIKNSLDYCNVLVSIEQILSN